MFDVMSLFVSTAWAADAVAPVADAVPQVGNDSILMRFMPFFLILAVFYVFVIRPQQKKTETHEAMLGKLKKGDKIITNGGFVGTITKIEGEHYIMLEIAKGVEIKVVKGTVSGPVDEAFPANQNK